MMLRHARILSVVMAVGLLLSACTGAAGGEGKARSQPVTVTADSAGSNIALTRDQQLIVRLASNHTTGYRWSLVDPTTNVLKAEGPPTYEMDRGSAKADVRMVGVGGTEIWKFTPTGAGQQSLRFEYRRPWEQGALPAQVVVYTVTVR